MEVIDHAHVLIVPPVVAALIVTIVERGLLVGIEPRGGECHRVLEKREVEVHAAVDVYLASVDAGHAELSGHVVVQRLALRLAELRANAQRVFVPRADTCGVGKREMAQLVLGEDLCSRLDPFVETFEQ